MMMSLQSRLLTFFDVRRHESRLVLLVLLYTILLYAGNLLTYTGAYSLFLTTYDVTALPAVYIGVSIVASLLALLYLQLGVSEKITMPSRELRAKWRQTIFLNQEGAGSAVLRPPSVV